MLALPSFRAAGAQVLAGAPDSVLVRWVHSSEVFEMGGLLAGGEVLLTTGLGLHGRTSEHLTAYVEQLADAGLAALALELGRTFFEVPAAILEAAGRRQLVVLGLTHVVPFERMVEDFHELVVRRRAHAGGGAGWGDLAQVVIDGRGLRALLDEVSRAAGSEVELRDRDEQLVERSTIVSVAEDAEVVEPVRGPAGVVGTLHVLGTATRQRRRAAAQGAVAVALELGRAGSLGQRPGPSQSLVSDLCAASPMPGSEVTDRLADLGWPPADGTRLAADRGRRRAGNGADRRGARPRAGTPHRLDLGAGRDRGEPGGRGGAWLDPSRPGQDGTHRGARRARPTPGRRCVRRRWCSGAGAAGGGAPRR